MSRHIFRRLRRSGRQYQLQQEQNSKHGRFEQKMLAGQQCRGVDTSSPTIAGVGFSARWCRQHESCAARSVLHCRAAEVATIFDNDAFSRSRRGRRSHAAVGGKERRAAVYVRRCSGMFID